MGEIIPIPLGPESDPARSTAAGDGIIVNGFVEPSAQGKEQYAIYADQGIDEFSSLGTTLSIRGLFALTTTSLYAIGDQNLYSVNSSGTETFIGTVQGTEPVITATNDKATPQIAIAADSKVYSLESNALTEITDADLPTGVHSVAFIDGYTLFGITDGRFFISALNNATSIDALDFAEAEGDRDPGVIIFVFGLEIWYFGELTTEVWVNTGNVDFPMERLPGTYMTVGCASKYTVKAFDNTVAWVTNKGIVVRAESYIPRRMSTHAVEIDIQRALDNGYASQLRAITFSEGGHEFYQLSGPDFTWVYDAATQLWHPKVSYDVQLGYQGTRSRITEYARCYNKHIVGDTESGVLGHLNFTAFDEYDQALVLTIQSPIMHAGAQRIGWNAFYLDMEMGVGINGTDTAAATYSPKAMLSWSDDGGKSYSAERERTLGIQGMHKGRMTFNRLGQSKRQGRIWRIKISAAVKRTVLGASADMEVLEA